MVVLECEADNMHSAWIDRITVERRGWGDFRVVTRRQLLDERRPRSLGDEAGIAGPDALAAKLEAVSDRTSGQPLAARRPSGASWWRWPIHMG